ncbi:hypothetical protein [Curtobacterium flaccumfaciens]|uniref:hypothetical protein n=1 Tax=Curtobacterium flaccumfaciens TaxID=2035 RepID=UPI001BDECB18|nr:hypothetical protein [Curtobacterium flaccumfaciens]MBT1630467.1 hypothetical protein [Curtobacterium flaccumfaciens pv. oortii]MCX2843946.1 hypothetical protein [Curtobacterium flaccumfaciens pv. oortii]
MATEYATIVVKRGGADEWVGSAIPLASGEWGYDETNRVVKIGDGFSPWADLPAQLTGTPTGDLPAEIRTELAAHLKDPFTPEGAAIASLLADSGGGGGTTISAGTAADGTPTIRIGA